VGAGLGRTGTHSLQLALQQLLDTPCYHMVEVVGHAEHVPVWQQANDGDPVDWDALFEGYGSAVDWPVAAFWRELAEHYDDAVVLLSERDGADGWWRSANATIFEVSAQPRPDDAVFGPNYDMVQRLFSERFTPGWQDEATAKAAYEAHNQLVRATIPPDRLVVWRPGDGWSPICDALGVPVPREPFPHVNTTSDFRQLAGLDGLDG
jgi:hypothetical protein